MYKKLLFLVLMVVLVFSQISYAFDMKPTAEINKMYYYLNHSQIHKFSCEVSTDLFEQMKEQIYPNLSNKDKKEIDRIKFYLTFKDQQLVFKASRYPKFSSEQMNKGMNQVIDGTDKMSVGFFKLWNGMILEPLFDEAKKYDFSENETGYTAAYKELDNNVQLSFDKDYILQKMIYGSEKQNFTLIPGFTPTNDGLLISKIDMDLGNGMMKEHMEIEYQEIKNIYLPESVKVKVNMFQTEQNVVLKFFNYKLN
ncbi:MAG TPA: hypothetical protein DDW50_14030 [Firmicutes bacterium]|jgi:hypothetical protein|nr:hypothetical protein [Bacillota bacterium]